MGRCESDKSISHQEMRCLDRHGPIQPKSYDKETREDSNTRLRPCKKCYYSTFALGMKARLDEPQSLLHSAFDNFAD